MEIRAGSVRQKELSDDYTTVFRWYGNRGIRERPEGISLWFAGNVQVNIIPTGVEPLGGP